MQEPVAAPSCGPGRDHDQLGDSLGWKWFEYHAKQRLDVFKFYLTIYAATMFAAGVLIDKQFTRIALLFGILAIAISIIFWQLDVRSRRLTEIGEKIVAHSWQTCRLPEDLNPIIMAAKQSGGLRYKFVFGLTYLFGALVGAVASVVGLSDLMGLSALLRV
jgi:hypothetical protein